MRFQDVDFAPARLRVPLWPLLLGMAALLALLAGLMASQQAQDAWAKVRAARAPAPLPQVAPPPMPIADAKAINQAIGILNVPWPHLLQSIEARRPAEAALMSLEPRPQDNAVVITAQAAQMQELLDFMGRLAETPPFLAAQSIQQESITLDNGEQIKRATFEARWHRAEAAQ